ncbi:Thylakoid soluble phosphoprotein TSP9 [Macleaya cordata]|uniref:Thylakoid soluble phosphoprotein TSP9 n=1 Tax=Macleaya cordata TaxID=56857 RepID=A0A200Q7Q2_MACCD|nr:Thylakoid soluble phosphoprotein TSP9 [Macleaya cordata]
MNNNNNILSQPNCSLSFLSTNKATQTTTAAKSSGGTSSSEEKGFLDWILGGMQKEDQFFETDPILKKVEDKNGEGTTTSRKNSVAVPPKKSGGFGGLFAKK